MHLVWISTVLFTILASPPFADAGYVIRLKNGNEYFTTRYWRDGRQILFDAYGGVFGVEGAFVAGIERAPQIQSEANGSRQLPESTPSSSRSKEVLKEPQHEHGSQLKEKADQSASDPIVSEFNRLRDRSKEVDSLLTSEILELLKEVVAFRNRLSKDSKLFIKYGREFNDAHEIGDVVESALRSRTQ